jgi:DNA-binding SARP family transcriptional activator
MGAKTPLRVTLLGRFALSLGSNELGIAASGQRLIALLALKDRPVGRLHVAGILWPDYPAERSLADLRTTLWRVNRLSERVIAATPSLLQLGPEVEVDLRNLLAIARHLNDAATRSGFVGVAASETLDLDSVRLSDLDGDLLPDWYDDWLQDEREGLRQLRLHALECLARAMSAAGRHADAIQAALAAIRLEPLRETAHRTLIQTHLAEGNWSEARRQFQRLRRLLRDELGVEPSDSTRLLVENGLQPARLATFGARAQERGTVVAPHL